ncbi:TPA: hypothetical protein QCX49_005742 [Bacillus mobilis]|nr:hypothetical protein [Bacillus mobilis]
MDFLLKFIFSHDYFFADVFKYTLRERKELNKKCLLRKYKGSEKHFYLNRDIDCKDKDGKGTYGCEIHQEKIRLKSFVIYSNWKNICSAGFLILISILIKNMDYQNSLIPGFGNSIKITINQNDIKYLLFMFVFVRLISRGIEVTVAFYNDVVKSKMNRDLDIGNRSTNLKRGHRISLAIHSYLEFVFLFSILYYLKPHYISGILPASILIDGYLDYLLYSGSVSAFNISFDIVNLKPLGKFLHTLQVFLSVNLIVLSVATYLGIKDEMNEYEKADWEEEQRKQNES